MRSSSTMRIPVEIQFRDMVPSLALEAAVREKIAALGPLHSDALSCHVTIEPSDRRHRHGRIHRFTIRLAMPGRDLVVSREPEADHAHEDPYVALRDAYDALRRQLIEGRRRQRHAH
jgi:ribosome-associated translation inhibitor RaiA